MGRGPARPGEPLLSSTWSSRRRSVSTDGRGAVPRRRSDRSRLQILPNDEPPVLLFIYFGRGIWGDCGSVEKEWEEGRVRRRLYWKSVERVTGRKEEKGISSKCAEERGMEKERALIEEDSRLEQDADQLGESGFFS